MEADFVHSFHCLSFPRSETKVILQALFCTLRRHTFAKVKPDIKRLQNIMIALAMVIRRKVSGLYNPGYKIMTCFRHHRNADSLVFAGSCTYYGFV